jgi:hypothetical protein
MYYIRSSVLITIHTYNTRRGQGPANTFPMLQQLQLTLQRQSPDLQIFFVRRLRNFCMRKTDARVWIQQMSLALNRPSCGISWSTVPICDQKLARAGYWLFKSIHTTPMHVCT